MVKDGLIVVQVSPSFSLAPEFSVARCDRHSMSRDSRSVESRSSTVIHNPVTNQLPRKSCARIFSSVFVFCIFPSHLFLFMSKLSQIFNKNHSWSITQHHHHASLRHLGPVPSIRLFPKRWRFDLSGYIEQYFKLLYNSERYNRIPEHRHQQLHCMLYQ